jgi:serine protease Do
MTNMTKDLNKKFGNIILVSVVLSMLTGFLSGGLMFAYLTSTDRGQNLIGEVVTSNRTISQEDSIVIDIAEQMNKSVVSIAVLQDVSGMRRMMPDFFGLWVEPNETQGQQEVGGGTGFIVSSDGIIITNKHVVDAQSASFTVILDDQEYPAEVLAIHPTQDLALLKIEATDLVPVQFADSNEVKVGQTVIAIGNALNEFNNTVSKGVISGLSRSIVASGGRGGQTERLSNIIQTDAAINPGNSGGPLLDINGKVIGVNVAVAQGAQSIGFAIPSNEAQDMLSDFREFGEIRVPYIGVRYAMLTENFAKINNLNITQGAIIVRGETSQELAILPGSPAAKAGLQEGDIIISVNDEELTTENPLSEALQKYEIGDQISLRVNRNGEESILTVTLEARPQND